jgi:hypothetical protein
MKITNIILYGVMLGLLAVLVDYYLIPGGIY